MNLEFQGVTKIFDGNKVLDNVTVSLHNVHAPVIIGPSGGGKSTILRLAAGLIVPEEGVISINGRELSKEEEKLRFHRMRIGMVFQSYNLFPHLTALENITLPLEKVQGYEKKDAAETAKTLLGRFKLDEHMEKYPVQMSGGQQQRVAIARAVASEPEVMLFDEPTSALDPEFTSEVLDMIEELREEGKDLILVTHEMGFARQVSDHVLFVDEGKLLDEGNAEHIFEHPSHSRLKNFLNKILKY